MQELLACWCVLLPSLIRARVTLEWCLLGQGACWVQWERSCFERIPTKAGRLDGVFSQGTLGREMACGASKVNGEC